MSDPVDRINGALANLVREYMAERLFGMYAYSVSSFDAGAQTVDAQPTRNTAGLPNISGVPVRSAKQQFTLTSGEQILVAFEGGDPTQPVVVNLDFARAYGTALPSARQGDMVSMPVILAQAFIGQPPVPIPNAYSIIIAGSPPPPPFVPGVGGPATLYATISSGSAVAKTK